MTREEKIKALEDLGVYYKWRVNCKSKRENPDSSLETREKRVEAFFCLKKSEESFLLR